jgi:hypothetical protein
MGYTKLYCTCNYLQKVDEISSFIPEPRRAGRRGQCPLTLHPEIFELLARHTMFRKRILFICVVEPLHKNKTQWRKTVGDYFCTDPFQSFVFVVLVCSYILTL